MPSPSEPTTPEEGAALNDFRATLWGPFQTLYEDKWDQARWDAAITEFKKRHSRAVLDALQYRKMIPPWDAVEAQLKKGPPPFLRPGWRSPLLGRRVNLDWIDQDSFICLQGSREGWRNKKVLIIEFWASWCRPCHRIFGHLSEIAANQPDVKVITFNHEGIFNKAHTNVEELRRFIAQKGNLNYPIFVDVQRVAIDALFKPGQNPSIPLVFMITPKDGVVHWVGNVETEDMNAPLRKLLTTL